MDGLNSSIDVEFTFYEHEDASSQKEKEANQPLPCRPKSPTIELDDSYKSPDEIENLCAICIDEINVPTTIQNCSHSFCERCLITYLLHRYILLSETLKVGGRSFIADICPCCRGVFDFNDLPFSQETFSS